MAYSSSNSVFFFPVWTLLFLSQSQCFLLTGLLLLGRKISGFACARAKFIPSIELRRLCCPVTGTGGRMAAYYGRVIFSHVVFVISVICLSCDLPLLGLDQRLLLT